VSASSCGFQLDLLNAFFSKQFPNASRLFGIFYGESDAIFN
jgi:hypothetical protein